GSRAVSEDELAELARVSGGLAALAGDQSAEGASVPAPPPAAEDSIDESLDFAFASTTEAPPAARTTPAPARAPKTTPAPAYRVPTVGALGTRPPGPQTPTPAPAAPSVTPAATTAAPPAQAAPAKRPSSRPVPSPGAPPPFGLATVISVLVVDDAQSEALIREALPADRFELMSATDPEEALRIARSAAPDVVVVGLGVLEL